MISKPFAGVNAHVAAVVVAILRVVGGLVAIVLIKKLPRCDDNGSCQLQAAILTVILMLLLP